MFRECFLCHPGLTVRALYTFEAEGGEELDLKEGQIYRVYEQNHNGWWKGVTLFGKCGWFPSTYVEIVTATERPRGSTRRGTEPLRLLEINVLDFERKYDAKKYYIYTIQLVWTTGVKIARIRYSKLRDLHDQLVAAYPDHNFPPFPDKIIFGRSHIQQVTQVRMLALNAFFNVSPPLLLPSFSPPCFLSGLYFRNSPKCRTRFLSHQFCSSSSTSERAGSLFFMGFVVLLGCFFFVWFC